MYINSKTKQIKTRPRVIILVGSNAPHRMLTYTMLGVCVSSFPYSLFLLINVLFMSFMYEKL